MSLQLSEVTSETDFEIIAPLLYAAFHEPYHPFYEFLNSTQGTYEEQIQAKAIRHAANWRADKAQHWLKITDPTKDDEIIAVASFYVHETVPEPSKTPFVATWHPEGSTIRAFTSKWLGLNKKMAMERMDRPHIEIDQLATHPEHRHRGAATMLIDWAIGKADQLGLEAYVRAAPFAAPFYQKLGFAQFDEIDPNMEVEEPSQEWRRLQAIHKRLYWMWRPKGGHYVDGKTKIPWINKSD